MLKSPAFVKLTEIKYLCKKESELKYKYVKDLKDEDLNENFKNKTKIINNRVNYENYINGNLQKKATVNPSLLADNVVEKYSNF